MAVVGTDPVAWGTDRWYDLTGEVEQVIDVAATAEGDAAAHENAERLVDHDPDTAWTMPWVPGETAPLCEHPHGSVTITFPESRIRGIRVLTGPNDPSRRPLQHIPTTLHVEEPGGKCHVLTLDRGDDEQWRAFDTKVDVSSLTLSIAGVREATDERKEDVAGIAALSVWAQP